MITQNDEKRRQEVAKLIASNQLQSPEDYYHAAMVFQHGQSPEDFKTANDLAKKSMDLGYEPANHLYKQSFDRYQLSLGLPQKYGTQYRLDEHGNEIYF